MPLPILETIGGLISSGLGFAGNQYNSEQAYRTARENTDKTIAANKAQAEYAYSKDLEMWNRQNQYNTPQAQMERIRAAGLNPNMAYGSGQVAGNTQGSTPKYQAPTVDYKYAPRSVDMPQTIGLFQDVQMKKAQTDNVKAQTAATYQNTANSLLDGLLKMTDVIEKPEQAWQTTRGLQASTGLKELELKQALATQRYQLTVMQEAARQATEGANLTAAQKESELERNKGLAEDTIYKKETNQWRKQGIMDTDNPLWRLFIKNQGPQKMKEGLNALPPWMQWMNPNK